MRGHLHHVELYVEDIKKTKEFYSWLLPLLGYKIFQTWSEGFSFKFDETYIVFVQAEDRFCDVKYNRCRPGINHLAFYGGDKQFVDELTEKLKDRNIKILYKDRHPYAGGKDYYAVYFEDTNRMKIEVVAE